MPRLWNETIDAHRAAVRAAILDTAAAQVAEHGLLSVTMSQIAEETGIGRATLYKYFSDVEAVLLAWHERQITTHVNYLADVRDQAGDAGQRLEAVLVAYALLSHESHGHHDTGLAALLHRDRHVAQAQHQLRAMIRDLLTEGAETGALRSDVAPDELASYCLHALTAASGLPSKAAVRRLVIVTLAGLQPGAGRDAASATGHPGAARDAPSATPQESGPVPSARGRAVRHDRRGGRTGGHARPPDSRPPEHPSIGDEVAPIVSPRERPE